MHDQLTELAALRQSLEALRPRLDEAEQQFERQRLLRRKAVAIVIAIGSASAGLAGAYYALR